ncbi:MAG: hypothetical protein AABX69_02110 [Nanoarchaeota archaeon]
MAKKALLRKTCASFVEPEAGNMLRQKDFIARSSVLVAFAALALILFSTLFIASGFMAAAHENDESTFEEGEKESGGVMLDEVIRQNTVRAVIAGSSLLIVLTFAAALAKRKKGKRRANPLLLHVIFWPVAAVVALVTVYVAGSTIYLNVVSESGGPVHWHADFEVWNCGQQLELVDPKGFSNRAGGTVLHEHNDNRMHIEGVVVDYGDVSIGSFFRSVGGDLHQGLLSLPTDEGLVIMKDGESCPESAGKLQVFVYKAADGKMVQEKLSDYEDYVPSPSGNIPPGDCLIFEFDSGVKEKTDKMCASYEVALKLGKVKLVNGGESGGG